jgi:TatA/E family protein of Tat protein translocase
MGYLTGGHLWLLAILLIIVLIIWGPGKLPDVGSGLGRAIREFRKATSETRDEFSKAARGDDTPPPSTPAAPAYDPDDVRPGDRLPRRAVDPLAPRDPTAPEVPVAPVPGAPTYPAPLGGGSVLGPPPDADPR